MSDFMRELAKEAATVRDNVTAVNVKKTVVAKTGPAFELTTVEYPDFVVTKTTTQMVKQLVVMPSQSAYYVKTTRKTGEPAFEKLTVDGLKSFLTGYDESIQMPEGFWMHYFENTKVFCESFIRYLNRTMASELLCCHAAPDFTPAKYEYGSKWNDVVDAYRKHPSLFREFAKYDKIKNFLTNNTDFVEKMWRNYGLDCCKDFCKKLNESLVDCSGIWCTSGYMYGAIDVIFNENMQYKAFADYILYDSVIMGYADNIRRFFDDWKDTLRMQKNIYGKVKEKYPINLPTMHQQLSYKSRKMQEQIDEQNFVRQVTKCNQFEMTIGDYVFICPKSKQDFLDEATQQANCLASYVSRFANGDSIIMFMRKQDTPDKSLVTIELGNDLGLRQAYRARNNRVSDDEQIIIDKWLAAIRGESLLSA